MWQASKSDAQTNASDEGPLRPDTEVSGKWYVKAEKTVSLNESFGLESMHSADDDDPPVRAL